MSKETFYEQPKVLDGLVSFEQDADGKNLQIIRTQEIPDWYLAQLAEERLASTNNRAGDFHHVASIPVEVCEELKRRYGFDVFKEPVRATLAMLRRLDLDLFIATSKKI
jgi:hypothetical protein